MVCLHTSNNVSHMLPVGDTRLVDLYLNLDAAACYIAPARTVTISNSSLKGDMVID